MFWQNPNLHGGKWIVHKAKGRFCKNDVASSGDRVICIRRGPVTSFKFIALGFLQKIGVALMCLLPSRRPHVGSG
jgi:hypothetical protein